MNNDDDRRRADPALPLDTLRRAEAAPRAVTFIMRCTLFSLVEQLTNLVGSSRCGFFLVGARSASSPLFFYAFAWFAWWLCSLT